MTYYFFNAVNWLQHEEKEHYSFFLSFFEKKDFFLKTKYHIPKFALFLNIKIILFLLRS